LRNPVVWAPDIPLLCLAIVKIEIRLGMLAGKFRLALFVQKPAHKSKTGRFLGWTFLETVDELINAKSPTSPPARPPPVT
jgi:hypothetical protein